MLDNIEQLVLEIEDEDELELEIDDIFYVRFSDIGGDPYDNVKLKEKFENTIANSGYRVELFVQNDEENYTIQPKTFNKNGDIISISTPINIKRSYVHKQDSASKEWIINHNLGKHPSVTTVEDRYGHGIIGEVEYVDENTIKIYFSAETAGKAYLN